MFLLGFILPGTLNFLNLGDCFLSHVREVFIYYLFKYFPMLFLSFPSGTSVMWLLVCLMLFQSYLKLSSYLFILFSLSYCTALISTILSFSSLICSSPSFILLSIPSVVFLFQLLCCSSLFVCYSDSEVARLCLTLCDPVNCSPPGSSVHGILLARILEWVAISFSRGSSCLWDRTRFSCLAGRLFNLWATLLYVRSSNFLLNISCISSVCASILSLRSWIIFTIHLLNYFLGRLSIATSLSCSFGVLTCSFTWNTFLCLLILSSFMGLLFPLLKLKGCSSSCLWCLPLGGWDWTKKLIHAFLLEGLAPAHW